MIVRSEEQKTGTCMDTFYEEDILGEGFQRTTLSLRDEYEDRLLPRLFAVCRIRGTVGRCFIFTVLMIIFFSGKWLVV